MLVTITLNTLPASLLSSSPGPAEGPWCRECLKDRVLSGDIRWVAWSQEMSQSPQPICQPVGIYIERREVLHDCLPSWI